MAANQLPPAIMPNITLPQETSSWLGSDVRDLTAGSSLLATGKESITQLKAEGKSLFNIDTSLESRIATIIFFVTLDVTMASYTNFIAKINPAGREIDLDKHKIANYANYYRAQVFGSTILQSFIWKCFFDVTRRETAVAANRSIYDYDKNLAAFAPIMIGYWCQETFYCLWAPLRQAVNLPEIWTKGNLPNLSADDKFAVLIRYSKTVFVVTSWAILVSTPHQPTR